MALEVDDGTSVIDCLHAVPAPPKNPTTSKLPPEPPTTPEPIASIGSLVCVVGKVTGWHNSRQIKIEHIRAFLLLVPLFYCVIYDYLWCRTMYFL
jgi:hypothetical protein